jgi:hypothetical protein
VSHDKSAMSSALEMLHQARAAAGRMLHRLWRAFFREPARTTDPKSFQAEIPCAGEAFSFRVIINEVWSGLAELDTLKLAVNGRIDVQRMTVERRLRAISRRFAPEATADLEEALNTALRSPSSFPGDLDLTCSYSVHVAPDSELHQHLRNAELERLDAQSQHVRKQQRLNDLELMRDRWLAFLQQFDGDPLGTLAAQLADDPAQLSDLIAKRTSEQERLTDGLRKLCDTTSEAYRDKDVFEFVNSTDSALSRLLRHVGIDGMSESDSRSQSR